MRLMFGGHWYGAGTMRRSVRNIGLCAGVCRGLRLWKRILGSALRRGGR